MKRALTAGGFLLGVALVASPARAQTGFAVGRVVDAEGQPVAGATVLAVFQGELPKSSQRKTNEKGEYVHAGLYSGRYRITVEKEGFETTIIEHEVRSGDPTEIPDIVLAPKERPEVAVPEAATEEEVKAKFGQAVDLTRAGQLDEAEALFTELLAVLPDVPEIYQSLGYIHVQRGDWPSAEASYLKALELRPGDADSMSALARVYQEMGEDEKALELTQQAARADAGNPLAQYNLGVLLLNSDNIPEAVQAFEAALASDAGLIEAHYHLGTLLIGQGRVAEAIEHLEAYLAADPENEQNVATARGLIEALRK